MPILSLRMEKEDLEFLKEYQNFDTLIFGGMLTSIAHALSSNVPLLVQLLYIHIIFLIFLSHFLYIDYIWFFVYT